MITIQKKYQLAPSSANPPYNYTWSTSGSCVVASPSSNTTDSEGKLDVTFIYADETCLTTSTATINYASTLGGCSYTNTVTPVNVCNNFSLNTISKEEPFTFRTSAFTNLCTSVAFNWEYDTTIFDLESISGGVSDSQLKLKLKSGVRPPKSTQIKVLATDCHGCTKTDTYANTFASVSATAIRTVLLRTATEYASNEVEIPTPTGATNPDWSTLEIALDSPHSFEIVSGNRVIFRTPLTTPAGNIQGTYTVQDANGILSSEGDIQLVVEGRQVNPINVADKRIELPCTLSPTDVYEIVIDDVVNTTGDSVVDWSTWTLLTTPNPIATTIALATNLNGQHVIQYTVPNPLSGDVFAWSVCDTNGYCSEASVITLVDCINPGTITNQTGCAICNQTSTYDVLTGTTFSDLAIVSSTDNTGGLTTVVNDKINFVAGNKAGTNVVTFNAEDEFNITSGNATETLTVICAGNNVSLATCDTTVTPFTQLETLNNTTLSTTGTWTYVGTSGSNPAAPGTYNGTLDFSSATPGLPYAYRYTVTNGSCTDTADITFTILEQIIVQNTICSKATILPGVATDTSNTDYTFFEQSNKDSCPGIAAPTFSAIAIPANWQSASALDYAGDLWFRIDVNTTVGGSIIMSVDSQSYGANSMRFPNLAIYSDCAGTLSESFSVTNAYYLTTGIASVSSSTNASFYIRVASLLGNEGKFNLNVEFTDTV